ncbi:MAG TPA: DUF2071 domain-containing protein [Planctomycetaceae bacterium]|nr:DUF2071 domain-containing protein [Planctomycetaceae bacterium]
MQAPVICGTIERRLLVNFRVDPDVLARWLPPPFRPLRIGEFGMAGICLIRLGNLRPRGWPAWLGVSSENAAHRIAVEWNAPDGIRRGVYVPRRDSNSRLNVLVGGRVFPGVHHLSRFDVHEVDDRYCVALANVDGTSISVTARLADRLPAGTVFGSLTEASDFFAGGSIGYSASRRPGLYEGLELRTHNWKIEPLAVEQVASSVFDDRRLFPAGTIDFDSAFLMRNVAHEWHGRESLCGNGRIAAASLAPAATPA